MYWPMKLRKTQNKILYVSRQSNTLSGDLLALKKQVEQLSPQTTQEFRLRLLRDEKGLSLSYLFGILGDMWSMATAKVVVADTYSIPLSCLTHKKEQSRVQIWHALGAVKQFGLQSAGKASGRNADVAKVLCMHQNYTHVMAPSQTTAEYYTKAFGCSSSVIHIGSLPRVDDLLQEDSKREEFLQKNPVYRNKRLVLYVPTFREKDETYIAALWQAFAGEESLGCIVAPHPLSESAKNKAYHWQGDFTTYDLMKVCDEIITDYSACSVEGALLQKPLWFFVPDYEDYKEQQGLNVELTAWFPNACFQDPGQLVEAIKTGEYDFSLVKDYAQTFVEQRGTNNSETVAKWICSLL